MKGQIGNWGNARGGLALGFSHEAIRWLDGQQHGRRIAVIVERNRQVIILPDRDGGVVTPCGEDRHISPYRYQSRECPSSLHLTQDLPLFGYHDVTFDVEDGCLSFSITEVDYELPWPKLNPDCSTYDATALAIEALQVRLNSLVASGMTTFPQQYRMPMTLRRLLPEGAWADCLATARSLSGVY